MNNYELRWNDPAWADGVRAWIEAETTRRSIRITGAIEQPHVYPWSTVLRVPTEQGTLFFKATAAETIYEAALTEKLANWFPDRLPELVAVDGVQGWMLMRDAGEPLRVKIRANQDIRPWLPAITSYAELQTAVAAHVPEILALGVPDWRLSRLPELYAALLEDREGLLLEQPDGLSRDDFRRVRGLGPRLQQIFDQLAAYRIPETLNHGDFHDGNVLVQDGRITLFDWGDGNITHPFASLRTLFVSIENSLKLDDYAFTPEMEILLDHYLSTWRDFASEPELRIAFKLSRPAATVVKTLAWHQTIARLAGPQREKYARIVPELFRELIVTEKMTQD